MSNTRTFSDFDSPDSGTTLGTTEAGVLTTDTLEKWREKTNGVIEKVKSIDTTVGTNLSTNGLALTKIEQISANKLLGNVGSGTGNVAEVEIDVSTGGLQDSDDTIPTSKAAKEYVDSESNTAVNLGLGYNQTYSTELLPRNAVRQNTGTRPIMVTFNLVDNRGVDVSNDGTTWITSWYSSADRGPHTIIVPPGAYYRMTGSTSKTISSVILS